MAPTQSIVDDLTARGFSNVVLWSRGVDTRLFSPGPRDRLDESAPPRFVYIGRVAVEKKSRPSCSSIYPAANGWWAMARSCPGLKKPTLKSFAGIFPQNELARFYRAGDVFVFPSKTDTFGLVLLEAMAMRHPGRGVPGGGAAGCSRKQWRRCFA